MSQIFESPMFGYLGQLGQQVDIYTTTFDSAEVEIMGESNYLNARQDGIAFALSNDLKIDAIFLYSEGVEEFNEYKGDIPGDLTLEMSRAQVRENLGEPSFSGESGGTGIMAIEFSFDRYESDNYYIRFEYTKRDEHIRLVTLGKV